MEISQVSDHLDAFRVPNINLWKLWVYPIKALRGCQIQTATLTREGFTHDRKFMLLRDLGKEFQNITITKYPSVCLFHTSIQGKTVTVSYRPPGGIEDEVKRLEIPLEPHLQRLKKIPVNMHFSPTTAFDMGQQYNEWFSDIFGVKVVLVYWGGNPRKVLGNLPERTTNVSSKPLSLISNILGRIPIIGSILYSNDWVIAFNDCAPFLVITEESTADVTKRLPDGVEMDITKFRSNIVLKKSSSAFEEDFWAELLFGEDTTMILTGNCGRCTSLNIDYHTGKSGTGRDGQVLKLLSKDRRVDQGVKYSPIFGRYGFVSTRCEGSVLAVGDEVVVSKRNQERTRFRKFF
jgi:uncharacterized protein YcbX